MILGSENQPQTVSQLASQSHMFYVSGEKSIDKNISLSYWFVIDYCFLVTQWLMIILFFGPEGHPHILSFTAESIIDWLGFSFGTFTLEWCWSPDPRFSPKFCVLFLILLPYHAFRNPACRASLDIPRKNWVHWGNFTVWPLQGWTDHPEAWRLMALVSLAPLLYLLMAFTLPKENLTKGKKKKKNMLTFWVT